MSGIPALFVLDATTGYIVDSKSVHAFKLLFPLLHMLIIRTGDGRSTVMASKSNIPAALAKWSSAAPLPIPESNSSGDACIIS